MRVSEEKMLIGTPVLVCSPGTTRGSSTARGAIARVSNTQQPLQAVNAPSLLAINTWWLALWRRCWSAAGGTKACKSRLVTPVVGALHQGHQALSMLHCPVWHTSKMQHEQRCYAVLLT